jgi:DNA repair exonuclease SbcCD nuclease subunit
MSIWHISDIHIGQSNDNKKYEEYKTVFDLLIPMLENAKDVLVIVITGDVFDKKVKFTPDDIVIFHHLMKILKNHHVVMIPGNHDTNLNNPNATDLISPIISTDLYPKLRYSKHTEAFAVTGVIFVHLSIID